MRWAVIRFCLPAPKKRMSTATAIALARCVIQTHQMLRSAQLGPCMTFVLIPYRQLCPAP
eukprot:6198769-Pleurochrysis_carterae.AAC.2